MGSFLYVKAADVMTRDVVTVAPDAPLTRVAALFEQHDFNALPVVDEGRLVGLVTKLDVLRGFVFTPESVVPHYREIMAQPASSVMRREVETIEPDLPLPRVLQRMVDTSYKSLPVVEGDRVVGMISRQDVVRALHASVEEEYEAQMDS